MSVSLSTIEKFNERLCYVSSNSSMEKVILMSEGNYLWDIFYKFLIQL